MKNIFVCATLALAAPLSGAQFLPVPVSLVATPEDFASLHIVPANAFCTPSNTETSERFKHYPEGLCFDSELEFKLDASIKLQTMQRQLQKRQVFAADCKIVERQKDMFKKGLTQTYPRFTPDVCPQEGEDLSVYVTRFTNIISTEVSEITSVQPIQELFDHDFWTMSDPLQCGLLAMNVDVGLISVNDDLPVLGHTPLQFAADKGNLDLVYFLFDKGASENGLSEDTFHRLFETIRKSTDERSLTALSKLKQRSHLFFVDWAKDMSPDLVLKKVQILLPNYHRKPFPKSLADMIQGDSPGELALKAYIKRYGYWFDFDCTIL